MGGTSVLIIGPNIEEQLAPWRDFEQTGAYVDRHVVSVDVLDQYRKKWGQVVGRYAQDPDGKLHDIYDKRFWRGEIEDVTHDEAPDSFEKEFFGRTTYVLLKAIPGKKPQRIRQVLDLPPGYKAVKVKEKDAIPFVDWLDKCWKTRILTEGQSPDLYGEHKFGWMRLDGNGEVVELIERTVPGGFWFWWCVIGQAWKLKPGAVGAPSQRLCHAEPPGFAGSALKGAIDFESMRARIAEEAGACWDKATFGDKSLFDGIIRSGYYDSRFISYSRDQYIQFMQDREIWPPILIKDGICIEDPPDDYSDHQNNALEKNSWHRYLNELVNALPDDTLMTCVHCDV